MNDFEKKQIFKSLLKEKNHEYYLSNKSKLLSKVECQCGKSISRLNLTTHKKSKIHNLLLQVKNQSNTVIAKPSNTSTM